MSDLELTRIGTIMEPEAGNPLEVEGVLNPAAARGPDGQLYLFPRLVAKGNYSRIGIARVNFNQAGDPVGVERIGIALQPEADYEQRADGTGGCEDPRITFVESLNQYVMTYVALSPFGPRVAIATSLDLFQWQRAGLVNFLPFEGADFDDVDDKDAAIFPITISDPDGKPRFAIFHRPHLWGENDKSARPNDQAVLDLDRTSIWISYSVDDVINFRPSEISAFDSHRLLASPEAPWERLKIGGGTPPILTRQGWLTIYHGVSKVLTPNRYGEELRYAAGLMILSKNDPRVILYRTKEPILTLDHPEERAGGKGNVVFPTGIDRRDDIGQPNRFDIYYGMGDTTIGAARLDLPETLELSGEKERL